MTQLHPSNLARSAADKANEVRVPLTRERVGVVDFARTLGRQIGDDHVGAFAASLTYHALFAIVPFLIFSLSLLGVFNATGFVEAMVELARPSMPEAAVTLLEESILEPIASGDRGNVYSIGALVSVLVALWGISGAMRSLMEAMNVMYDVREGRSLVRRYAVSIALSIATVTLFLLALAVAVAGPRIGDIGSSLGLGETLTWTWAVLQWPVMLTFVLLAYALAYWAAPNVDQAFRFISPGAVVGALLWALFSLGFSLYVNNFGSYDATYGSLAGVIVLMLYIYYSSFILLLGAEINQLIQRYAPGAQTEPRQLDGEPS